MEKQISPASTVMIIVALIAGIAVPVALFLYLKKKKHADLKPFLVGWIAFFAVVMVLERLFHTAVLNSPLGPVLNGNLFFYALYGGLIAGLFEELARYFCWSRLLRDHLDEDVNALMYGAGHGGSEMFNLLTVTMASNLVYALTINTSGSSALMNGLSPEQASAVGQIVNTLANTPAYMYLFSILERISALVIQLSLSVLVFYSVKYPDQDRRLLLLSVELHALVDFLSVIFAGTMPIPAAEVLIALMALGTAWFARMIWKNHQTENSTEKRTAEQS